MKAELFSSSVLLSAAAHFKFKKMATKSSEFLDDSQFTNNCGNVGSSTL